MIWQQWARLIVVRKILLSSSISIVGRNFSLVEWILLRDWRGVVCVYSELDILITFFTVFSFCRVEFVYFSQNSVY